MPISWGLPRREKDAGKVCWVMMNLQWQICSFLQPHVVSKSKAGVIDSLLQLSKRKQKPDFIQRRKCQAHTQWFSNTPLWSQRMISPIMPTAFRSDLPLLVSLLFRLLWTSTVAEKRANPFVLSVAYGTRKILEGKQFYKCEWHPPRPQKCSQLDANLPVAFCHETVSCILCLRTDYITTTQLDDWPDTLMMGTGKC